MGSARCVTVGCPVSVLSLVDRFVELVDSFVKQLAAEFRLKAVDLALCFTMSYRILRAIGWLP